MKKKIRPNEEMSLQSKGSIIQLTSAKGITISILASKRFAIVNQSELSSMRVMVQDTFRAVFGLCLGVDVRASFDLQKDENLKTTEPSPLM